MKMSALIKKESMALLHNNEVMETREVLFFFSALLLLSTSVFGLCSVSVRIVLYAPCSSVCS